ncbi:hypothetical protein PG997_013903 [Apiospora hydei]|uniref:Uncharacterized protein n=1 Tax=Apiospora hydei TaxID=1337664 RepID=A0ABR1V7I6_9PEZI
MDSKRAFLLLLAAAASAVATALPRRPGRLGQLAASNDPTSESIAPTSTSAGGRVIISRATRLLEKRDYYTCYQISPSPVIPEDCQQVVERVQCHEGGFNLLPGTCLVWMEGTCKARFCAGDEVTYPEGLNQSFQWSQFAAIASPCLPCLAPLILSPRSPGAFVYQSLSKFDPFQHTSHSNSQHPHIAFSNASATRRSSETLSVTMLHLWIIFVAVLQACLAMGSPIAGGGVAVTTSIIPNPRASAVPHSTSSNKGGIVAAGLDDTALRELYASVPRSEHSSIKVIPPIFDSSTGYLECYPLWGPSARDCQTLSPYIANRSTVIDNYEVDGGYCWDAQYGSCRTFLCAEASDTWLVAPSYLAGLMDSIVDKCIPNGTSLTQSGHWRWNTTDGGAQGGTCMLRCSEEGGRGEWASEQRWIAVRRHE